MPTRVFGLSGDLTLNSAGFEAGARRSRESMKSLARDIRADTSKLSTEFERVTASAAAFAKGLAGGAIAAAASVGVSRLIAEVKEAEAAQLRLQGVLKATGYSARLSSDQIIDFADDLERKTLLSSEAIQGSAAALATFRSISGPVFTETLGLAADLAETMQGDLKGATLQLGKALEDPVRGLSALRESGVSFTAQQQSVIKGFVDTNQVAKAQAEILGVVRDQVGGTAEALGSGLAGSLHRADTAMGDFLQTIEGKLGLVSGFGQFVEAATLGLNKLTAAASTAEKVAGLQREIVDLSAQLDREREGIIAPTALLTDLEQQIAARRAEMEALIATSRAAQEAAANVASKPAPPAASKVVDLDAARSARETTAVAKAGISEVVKAEQDRAKIIADIRDRDLAEWERYYAVQASAAEDAATREREAREEVERERLASIEDVYQAEMKRVGDLLDGPKTTGRDPWMQATDRLQDSVSSAVEDGLRSGFDAQSIVDGFGSVLTATISESITASLFENASLKGALGTKLSDLGIGGFGDGTVGQAGAIGIGSAFAGYGIGRATGSRGIGLVGGAASGAMAGSTLGPYGAIAGGIIGGVAGFIGGGATGGQHNDNFVANYDLATGQLLDTVNTRPSAQNQSIVGSVAAEVAALRDGLRGLGLGVGGGVLELQSGNKSGLTLDGERFGSTMALTEAALKAVLGGAEGLSANQNLALKNTRATNASGILGDLDLARQFDDLRAGGGALGQQLRENERQFDSLRTRAEELGLSTKVLDQTQAKDLATIRQTVEAQLGLVSPLTATIRNIKATFGEAIDNAEALGLSEEKLIATRDRQIEAVRKAAEEQRKATEEQRRAERLRELEGRRDDVLGRMGTLADQVRAGFADRAATIAGRRQDIALATDPLSALRSDILVGDLGGRDAAARLGSARTLYERAVRDARNQGTTADEAQAVADRASTYIDAARTSYGSGAPANDIIRDVLGTTNELLTGLKKDDKAQQTAQRTLDALEEGFERTLPKEIRASGELTAAQVAAAVKELKELRREFIRLADDMSIVMRKKA